MSRQAGLHPPCLGTMYPKSRGADRVMLKALSKDREPHSCWPTREGHVPSQQCHPQLSLGRASWHFWYQEQSPPHSWIFAKPRNSLEPPWGRYSALPEAKFSQLLSGAVQITQGCDVAPAKGSPADTEEPETFGEVTKDHELSFQRCWKL